MADYTTALRKRRQRARRKEAGISEVRGIWLPIDMHAAVKAFAQSLDADQPTCHTPAGDADPGGG